MEYKITNITAKGELGFKLNLNLLALELKNSEYEPEKFSGLIYRLTPATFLIYKSGKFICTGLKSKEEIEISIKQLRKTLENFKNKNKK